MELKKPSSKNVTDFAILGGGAVAGAAVSRGVVAIVHTDTNTGKIDAVKLGKRLAVAIGGIVLASAATGNDTVAQLVRGSGLGMAVMQGVEIIGDLTANNEAVKKLASGTSKKDVFIAKTLGLGCACSGSGLGYPRRRRALRAPEVSTAYLLEDSAANAMANNMQAVTLTDLVNS